MAQVEPFGEDRADLRAKLNTQAMFLAHTSPENFLEAYDALDNYTGDDSDSGELPADKAALEKIKRRQNV